MKKYLKKIKTMHKIAIRTLRRCKKNKKKIWTRTLHKSFFILNFLLVLLSF